MVRKKNKKNTHPTGHLPRFFLGLLQKIAPLFSIVFILVLWERIIEVQRIPKYILPKPTDIVHYLQNEFFGQHRIGYESLLVKSVSSLTDALIGFLFSMILGTILGLLFSRHYKLKQLLFPLLFATQLIPLPAFAPLVAALFGFGFVTKICIVVLFTVFPIIMSVYRSVLAIPPHLTSLCKSFNAGPLSYLRHLIFPHILPALLTNAKILSVVSFSSAIIAELSLTTSSGIGKDMYTSFNNQLIPRVWSGVVIISSLSYLLYYCFSELERYLLQLLFLKHHD